MSNPIGLLYQLESKADAKDTSDYERSLLYMVLALVAHISDYSDQVASIGQEANVFSNIKSDIKKGAKSAAIENEALIRLEKALQEGKLASTVELGEFERPLIKQLTLLAL